MCPNRLKTLQTVQTTKPLIMSFTTPISTSIISTTNDVKFDETASYDDDCASVFSSYSDGTPKNRCMVCNEDMGKSNPRQLCGKITCDNITEDFGDVSRKLDFGMSSLHSLEGLDDDLEDAGECEDEGEYDEDWRTYYFYIERVCYEALNGEFMHDISKELSCHAWNDLCGFRQHMDDDDMTDDEMRFFASGLHNIVFGSFPDDMELTDEEVTQLNEELKKVL